MLSDQYKDEDSFDDYENSRTIEIVKNLGYDVKYFKSENFLLIVNHSKTTTLSLILGLNMLFVSSSGISIRMK